MNPNREALLFQLALSKPAAKRAAWLDAECEGEATLRQRLEALLAAHDQPETLLATQADTARPTVKLGLADAPEEIVGQKIGRYKTLERVGVGGCGVVYVAEQTESRRAHGDQAGHGQQTAGEENSSATRAALRSHEPIGECRVMAKEPGGVRPNRSREESRCQKTVA